LEFVGGLSVEFALGATAILALIGGRDAWQAWLAWRTARAIGRARGGSSADRVLLEGTAAPLGPPVTSTLSRTPALYESWLVERWRDGERTGQWMSHEEGASNAPFALRTARGTVLVAPAGAQALRLPSRQWRGNDPRPDPGAAPPGILGGMLGHGYRYTEAIVQPDQPLFVLGRPGLALPGDPPGIVGRVGAGAEVFVIGGEPPELGARGATRSALVAVAKAAAMMAIIAVIWLARA
jgi:hypothetical protein